MVPSLAFTVSPAFISRQSHREHRSARRPRWVMTFDSTSPPDYVESVKRLLRDDLPKMFNLDHEPDWTVYAPEVVFEDPMTRFRGVGPYKANIRMLKDSILFTQGRLDIHEIWTEEREKGQWSIMTRWTLTFKARIFPWRPTLQFTGTSEYVMRSDGKVIGHIDRWDSIENQKFLSIEAVKDFSGQFFAPPKDGLPSLGQRSETLIRRYAEYEIWSQSAKHSICTEYENRIDGISRLSEFCGGENRNSTSITSRPPLILDFRSDLADEGKKMHFLTEDSSLPDANDTRIGPGTLPEGNYARLTFKGLNR